MGFGSRDVISALPNHLISHILSFLSTKEAASTSVLSKKWRYLFAFVTNLDFDFDGSMGKTITSFMEFVDRVLALQGNGTINKFCLKCNDRNVDQVHVTGWILNVLGRGISELDLSLLDYLLPSKIFVSKTLVTLKLGVDELYFTVDGEDVFLPKLKTLHIHGVVFKEEGVGLAKLLSGSPVLEELFMMNIEWDTWKFCSVSIASLKRLRFFCEEDYIFQNPKSVSFDTPNLEYLEYSDTIAYKYPKVNFDSLVEAHIGLRLLDGYFSEGDDEEKEMVGNTKYFLMGIRNVQILYLSAKFLEVLAFCCEAIPVFNNLIQLTIESNPEIGWKSLPGLLKNCPKLETLVFKGLIHKYNDGCGDVCRCKGLKNIPSCLSSSPVKVLKISMFKDSDKDMMETEHIKHFLDKMPRLEELIVYYKTSYDPAVSVLFKKLERIPKIASPKSKIQKLHKNPNFPLLQWALLLLQPTQFVYKRSCFDITSLEKMATLCFCTKS